MRGSKRHIQKATAWVFALLFLLLLLLSSAVMVSAIGHHCIGDHCEICFNVHLLTALLRQLTWLWGLGVAFASTIFLPAAIQAWHGNITVCFTPVRLRVRMNN